MTAPAAKPNYGLDAPQVVRNLLVSGSAAIAISVLGLLGVLPRVLELHPTSSVELSFPLIQMFTPMGIALLLGGFWMYYDSRYGKYSTREELLDHLSWTGAEQVLDIGCGRGLMLVGAAKRLSTGHATGIDIWQASDLTGNRPEAPLQNAELEGVKEKVSVQTADMRKLPFASATFDAIVSRAAIHNLYKPSERQAAVTEVGRVLKPGGKALINDIRHFDEYRRAFESAGCDVQRLDSRWWAAITTLVTFGSLKPHTLLATKRLTG